MNEGWFNLWLNLELMLPGVLDCTVDNLRLVTLECHRESWTVLLTISG